MIAMQRPGSYLNLQLSCHNGAADIHSFRVVQKAGYDMVLWTSINDSLLSILTWIYYS